MHHPLAAAFRMAREVLDEAEEIARQNNMAIPQIRMRLIDIQTAERQGARLPRQTHRGQFDTPQQRFNQAFGQIAQV